MWESTALGTLAPALVNSHISPKEGEIWGTLVRGDGTSHLAPEGSEKAMYVPPEGFLLDCPPPAAITTYCLPFTI
jgi:hypothetical protein